MVKAWEAHQGSSVSAPSAAGVPPVEDAASPPSASGGVNTVEPTAMAVSEEDLTPTLSSTSVANASQVGTAGDESGARPAMSDHVRVTWAELGECFDGQVVDTIEQLGVRGEIVYSYQVAYFDGDRRWHKWNTKDSPQVEILPMAPTDAFEGVETSQWEQLELRCSVSFQRLDDPARLKECRHRSCCNYSALHEYGRSGAKACPVAGCDAKYGRRHALCRDDALRTQLAAVPSGVTTVWLRGSEVRTEPQSGSSADVAAKGREKRSRDVGPSSAPERCAMRRRGVIALE